MQSQMHRHTYDVTAAYFFQVCPSDVADADRVDCFPEEGATKEECNQRGCLWCESETAGAYHTSSRISDDAVFDALCSSPYRRIPLSLLVN